MTDRSKVHRTHPTIISSWFVYNYYLKDLIFQTVADIDDLGNITNVYITLIIEVSDDADSSTKTNKGSGTTSEGINDTHTDPPGCVGVGLFSYFSFYIGLTSALDKHIYLSLLSIVQ